MQKSKIPFCFLRVGLTKTLFDFLSVDLIFAF